ncbi:MAG: FAD:protein FMN transferase [Sulfurovum sp.]|nr:FAD:protein FMN transferase [Sulfurovum sp.]
MAFFEKALKAKVMSTHLLIRANVSKNILLQAHKIATDFESRYSAYKEDSFLNTINKNAGHTPTPCTEEDYILFDTSLKASRQTHGLFDMSIGALSHGVYHFGFANEAKASSQIIEKQKSLVNYKNIILTPSNIMLKKKGMRLDLGGIGKGYVAKQIALFLEKKGASKILVDVGGEIITRGKSYTIALNDPFSEGNFAYIKTSKEDMSISTSGSYERFIDKENHHILDHRKGISNHYYSSMSILQNGWQIEMLDAYATALFNREKDTLEQHCERLNLSLIAMDNSSQIIKNNIDTLDLKSLKFL